MVSRLHLTTALLLGTTFFAGCAADGSLIGADAITTASVPQQARAQAPKVDPVCVALAAQIDGLRKEGTVGRVEQAASGKTKTVSIKRASLAKIAEFNAANAEFQAKCSTISPAKPQVAATATPAAVQQAKVAAQAATTAKAK